jgi:hypothetical protein
VKRSWFFIVLLTIISLALAGTAAYFSIFGLSKLFVGAGIGIIILASVLEAAKLTAVSYVYRYWKYLAFLTKTYFITGIVVIMLITSLGIYGYLTGSYQKTANKVEYRDSQIKIAENRKSLFVAQLDRINKTIESDNNRINQLSNVRGMQEKRLDVLVDRKQSVRDERKSISGADEQIKILNADITEKMKQSSAVNDSISFYDNEIVTLKTSDVSNEVGPLKFISDFTGWGMSKVVNILVLLLIFVFDPMAIMMLISVNQLTMIESDKESSHHKDVIKLPKFLKKRKKEEEVIEPEIKEEPENIEDEDIESIELYNQDRPIIEDDVDVQTAQSNPSRMINLDEPIIEDEIEIENDDELKEEIKETSKKNVFLEPCREGYSEEKIDLNKSDIKEGLKVYHNTFGRGKILKSDIEKNRVLIHFEEMGIKELNPDFANLSQLVCIENVKYLDFSVDDPEIQDIIAQQTPIEEEPQKETITENKVEKKTKLVQRIWRGKRMI